MFQNKINQHEDQSMLEFNKMERSAEFKFGELNDCHRNHEIKVVEVNEMKLKGRRCIDAPIRAMHRLEQICKRQDFQGMEEHKYEASGVNVSPPYHEISEGISCNGNLSCHSEGEVSRHSLVEKWTIRTVAIHDADIKAEMMFKFNEIKDFDELKIEEEKYSEYGA